MKISKANIGPLNPCTGRYSNFLKFYDEKDFTLRQFLGLKNITHEDKIWVCFRLMPRDILCRVCADIAESVLHIYEEKYPNDDRPRKAIEACRAGGKRIDAHNASFASAYAADDAASFASAYAAYAFASVASSAPASFASAYAADAAAASAAACFSSGRRTKQEKLIRTIIIRNWKEYNKRSLK